MVVRDVENDCTVVGIPGRVVHQSGVRVNPLAHSALPDAEANVIRNLMERIDYLELEVQRIKEGNIQEINSQTPSIPISQNLKDKEILRYIGEND